MLVGGKGEQLKTVTRLSSSLKTSGLKPHSQIYSFLLKDIGKHHEYINRIMDDILLIHISKVPKVENIDKVEKELMNSV